MLTKQNNGYECWTYKCGKKKWNWIPSFRLSDLSVTASYLLTQNEVSKKTENSSIPHLLENSPHNMPGNHTRPAQHVMYVDQIYKPTLSSPLSEVIAHLAHILKQRFKTFQTGRAEVNDFAAALLRYGGTCLVCLTIWPRRIVNRETRNKWFSHDFIPLPADRNISGTTLAPYEIPRSLNPLWIWHQRGAQYPWNDAVHSKKEKARDEGMLAAFCRDSNEDGSYVSGCGCVTQQQFLYGVCRFLLYS